MKGDTTKYYEVTYVTKENGREIRHKVVMEGESVKEVREFFRNANRFRKSYGMPHFFRIEIHEESGVKQLSRHLGAILLPH